MQTNDQQNLPNIPTEKPAMSFGERITNARSKAAELLSDANTEIQAAQATVEALRTELSDAELTARATLRDLDQITTALNTIGVAERIHNTVGLNGSATRQIATDLLEASEGILATLLPDEVNETA